MGLIISSSIPSATTFFSGDFEKSISTNNFLIPSYKKNEGSDYINHPIKRISLLDLLGQEATNMVLKEQEDELSQLKEKETLNYKGLPFCLSNVGFSMDYYKGLSVSSCGDKVWSCQIQKKVEKRFLSKLMMYDFNKKSHFLYNYEHLDLIGTVLVSEAFGLAVTGGLDQALVLHSLESGIMIKRFDMKYGYLKSVFDLGTAVAFADKDTIRFLDLETKEMNENEVKASEKSIICMNLSMQRGVLSDDMALLVGGALSNKFDKMIIPQTIARLGKQILEIKNRPKNTEIINRKIFQLENENKRLREENQGLKD